MLCMMSSCVHRFPDPEGSDARDMMRQTVKISVSVAGTKLYKDEEGVVQKKEEVIGWSGSGVVVAVDASKGKGESLVMTAAHVSNVPRLILMADENGNPELFVVEAVLEIVEKADGSACAGEPIYADVPNDVGVVRASCIAGEVAKIADELPPVGAIVSTSGAALGIHPNDVFIVTDGRYVGFDDGFDGQIMLTLPVAPGHSGSGVFYHGKVFGIISRRTNRFEHVTLAVPLQHVRDAYDRSMETWNAN